MEACVEPGQSIPLGRFLVGQSVQALLFVNVAYIGHVRAAVLSVQRSRYFRLSTRQMNAPSPAPRVFNRMSGVHRAFHGGRTRAHRRL